MTARAWAPGRPVTVGGWVGHVWADGPAPSSVWAALRPLFAPQGDAQLLAVQRPTRTRRAAVLDGYDGATDLLARCERLRATGIVMTVDDRPPWWPSALPGQVVVVHAATTPPCPSSSGRPVHAEPGYPAPLLTAAGLAWEALYRIPGDEQACQWVRRCSCLLAHTPPTSLTARRRRRTA